MMLIRDLWHASFAMGSEDYKYVKACNLPSDTDSNF
jgi:hypothetical protein